MATHVSIIPEPKKVKTAEGYFTLTKDVEIINDQQSAPLMPVLRKEFKERLGLNVNSGGRGGPKIFLHLNKKDGVIHEQGYSLNIDKSRIVLTGRDKRGLFYGIQSLISLAKKDGVRFHVPCGEIRDWPDLAIRGVHLHFWANIPKYPILLHMVKELARNKINMVILEYADMFPYQRHPLIKAKDAFTREQIKEIVNLAEEYCVDLVPLVASLGHAEYFMTHRKYAHLKELPDCISDMCPLKPGTLRLVQDLYQEQIAMHPSKYFHVGGDEVFHLGECPHCRKYVSQKGMAALFNKYYSQLCNWVRDQGKVPMIWGDQFIKFPEGIDAFPKNVIITDWDYSGHDSDTSFYVLYGMTTADTLKLLPKHVRNIFEPYWRNKFWPKQFKAYPYVRFFQDHGFKVIGSSASSERDFSGRYNNNRRFSQRLVSEKALGLLNTHWSGALSIEMVWHALLACAEYSWNVAGASRQDFDDKFTAAYFGADPANCRMVEGLTLLGNVWCPDKNEGTITRDKILSRIQEADKAYGLISESKAKLKKNKISAEYYENMARIAGLRTQLDLIAFDAEGLFLGENKKAEHFCVDLTRQVNHDHRLLNLRTFPCGKQYFRDIPFQVINPDRNHGKSSVFLKGTHFNGKEYPKEVRNIVVNAKATRLYFLHSGGWLFANKKGEKIAEYRMKYADGSMAVKNIVNGGNIGDSYGSRDMPRLKDADAFVAWKGDIVTGYLPSAMVYITYWDNPFPEKAIQSIDLVSCETAVPVLTAITGERAKKEIHAGRPTVKKLLSGLGAMKKELALVSTSAATTYRKFLMPLDVKSAVERDVSEKSINEKIDSLIHKLKSWC